MNPDSSAGENPKFYCSLTDAKLEPVKTFVVVTAGQALKNGKIRMMQYKVQKCVESNDKLLFSPRK